MIDTTALTALITAFRAEVTQNSISPEKVGSILQQIADLLATAAPDSGMNEFSSCIVLYVNYAKIHPPTFAGEPRKRALVGV